MTAVDALADELLTALTRRLREQPRLRAELRSFLSNEGTTKPVEPSFVTVSEYALRLKLSKRTVENLIREGLPLVGRGRCRRVPVREADEWMHGHRVGQEVIERRARDDARRAARARIGDREKPQI